MKDNSSITSKMINRNWVLKRKRRKLPSGADKSNGNENNSIPPESPSNTLLKRKITNEITSDRSYNKKKGDDGVSYLLCLFLILFASFVLQKKKNFINKRTSRIALVRISCLLVSSLRLESFV